MNTISSRKIVCHPRLELRNWPDYHLDCSTKGNRSLSREQEICYKKSEHNKSLIKFREKKYIKKNTWKVIGPSVWQVNCSCWRLVYYQPHCCGCKKKLHCPSKHQCHRE